MSRASEIFTETLRWCARHPDQIILIERATPLRVDLSIRCHPEDAPRLVGKEGMGVSSLSAIARCLWRADGKIAEILRGGIQDNGSDAAKPKTPWDGSGWKKECERGVTLLGSALFERVELRWTKDDEDETKADILNVHTDLIGMGRRIHEALSFERIAMMGPANNGHLVIARLQQWQPSETPLKA